MEARRPCIQSEIQAQDGFDDERRELLRGKDVAFMLGMGHFTYS